MRTNTINEITKILLKRYDCKSMRVLDAIEKHEYATDHFDITTIKCIVEDLVERMGIKPETLNSRLKKDYKNYISTDSREHLNLFDGLSASTLIKEGAHTERSIELNQKAMQSELSYEEREELDLFYTEREQKRAGAK